MRKKTLIKAVLIAIIAVLFLPPLVVPFFIPWSKINCRHQDINIKTGHVRYSRNLWFVELRPRIKDTPLSSALHGETVDVNSIDAWQRANVFSPWLHHSPHYMFHGALSQARQFGNFVSSHNLTPDQERETARGILTTWQTSGSYYEVFEYLSELRKEYSDKRIREHKE